MVDFEYRINGGAWQLVAGQTLPYTITASGDDAVDVRGIGEIVQAGAYQDPVVTPPDPDADAMLLFVTGQSNSRVAGTSSATPPARYTDGSLGAMFSFVDGASETDGQFQPYDVTTNADPDNSGTAWGAEAEFVFQMREAGDTRPVYVVKRARNGQNLYDQWHPDTAGGQFDSLRAKIARARALLADAGVTIGPEVLIWNQGEADASQDFSAASYEANLSDWFAAVRAEITTGLIVVQRIRPLGYGGSDGVATEAGWPRAWTVREAQISVVAADANAIAVDTDFIPSNFGNIHPNEPWIEGLGERSYAAYAGTYTASFGSLSDAVPAAFDFADVQDVAAGQIITSNAVLLTGFERRTAVSVTGGAFRTLNSLNGDSVVSDWGSVGVIDTFQKIQLRATSGGLGSTVTVSVDVGGIAAEWAVSTASGTASFEPETDAFAAQAVANGGVTLSGAQKDALDAFYVAAKASTWWPKMRRLYVSLADVVSSGMDLKEPSVSLAQVGNLASDHWVWAAGQGWSGLSSSNGGLDMGFAPASEPDLRDNMSIGVFCSSFSTNSAPLLLSKPGQENYLRATTNGQARGRVNQGSNTTSGSVLGANGWVAAVRTDAGSLRLYHKSATPIDTEPDVSVLPSDGAFEIGNSSGTYGNGSVLGAFIGEAMRGAELVDLASAVDTLHGAFGH
ncbi:sialate O-acetylesterase [Shimia sp. MMG029]|uniref:sialate O-acetylesterase n=1 Tax=Shimia sp. MMG029 TaxID=3021978 RepID=UPI0022FE10CE|nr:sialate O-acetylesterase [Shimia sp. MMG029]MDA5555732.1 sialate O-acetylesterase [Shimia sp. MMG029]